MKKKVIAVVIVIVAVSAVLFGWTQRQKALKYVYQSKIPSILRSAKILKPSVSGYFQALETQNLLYDLDGDGAVTGKDYPKLIQSLGKTDSQKPSTSGIGLDPRRKMSIGLSESDGEAGAENFSLPSVRGFAADLFTGAATTSYPLELPPYKANLSPGLALSYSSGTVDDLYAGTETKWRNSSSHPYQKQAGVVGLGWGLNGLQYIARDNAGTLNKTSDDSFILVFAGGSASLTKESDENGYSVWRTIPNLKVKIERWSRCKNYKYDGGEMDICRYHWAVTGGGGTKYYFGYPSTVNNWQRPNDPDNEYFSQGSGNDWYPLYDETADGGSGYASWVLYGSGQKGFHALTSKWMLYQAESVYDQNGPSTNPISCIGCEAEINYRYAFQFGDYEGKKYPAAEYPLKISYGSHEVAFGREPRLDFQTHIGDDSQNDQQAFRSLERINKISVKTSDKIVRVYKLEYQYGWDPNKHQDDGDGIPEDLNEVTAGQAIHSLLTKITAYSGDPDVNSAAGRLPSSTFSYGNDCDTFKGGCPLTAFTADASSDQSRTANDFFLKSAGNGSGGKVDFEYFTDELGYNALNIKYCDPDKASHSGEVCKTDHAYNLQRHRLRAKIAHDGMNNTLRTEFNYTGGGAIQGLAYVKGYGEEYYEGQNCCNVKGGECQAGKPSGCRCPEDSETCVSNHGWDCIGGKDCSWDDMDGLCCPSDLPNERAYRCENPDNGNRYICPGTKTNPNTTCFSNCKYRLQPFADFEFLGYPEAETVVYEKNSSTKIAAKTKSFYHQSMETSSCFRPSPLKGMVSKNLSYDANDPSRYEEEDLSYVVRFGPMFGDYTEKSDSQLNNYCSSYDPETKAALPLMTQTVSKAVMPDPQLCVKNTTDYNFADGGIDHYALPHKTVNWGKVNCADPSQDDSSDTPRYSFTEYTDANDLKGFHPRGKESWISDSVDGEKYQHSRIYYDNRPFGEIGDYGNVTKTETLLDGNVYSSAVNEYSADYPWQVVSSIDPLGRTASIEYDTLRRTYPTKTTNALGQSITTNYDFTITDQEHPNYGGVLGLPVKIIDLNGHITSFVYDDFGRKIETYLPGKSPAGGDKPSQYTKYYYFNEDDMSPCMENNHCLTNLGKQINGQYGPKTMVYAGARLSDEGTAGKVSALHTFYDGFGQKVQNRSLWYENEWTSAGIPVDGEGDKDILSSQTYNGLGQIEYQSSSYTANPYVEPSVPEAPSSFDTRDFTADPGIKKTSYSYDGFGRNQITTYPDGTMEKIEYEVGGDPLKTKFLDKNCTDSDSNTKCLERITINDVFGQTMSTEQAGDGQTLTTSFLYHQILGLKTETKDNRGNVVSRIEYDRLGQKTKMWDIDMSPSMDGDENSWRYEYDLVGNLVAQTDPRGVKIEQAYDNLNRLTVKKADSVKVIENNYDTCKKGQLCNVKSYALPAGNQVEERTYTYDYRGRVTKEVQTLSGMEDAQINGLAFAVNYTYDEGGRTLSAKYSGGATLGISDETIVYAYNRPSLAGLAGNAVYVSAAHYNKDDQLTDFTSGNGVISTYSYNSDNLRLTSIDIGGANIPAEKSLKLGYSHDPIGNITQIADINRVKPPDDPFYLNQLFTYDVFNRLVSASGAYTGTYNYDDLGNITAKTDNEQSLSYFYENYPSNYYHLPKTIDISGSSFGYSRDPVGNVISDGDQTYSYDTANNLLQVSLASGGSISFVHNALGQRLAKFVSGGARTYYLSPYLEVIFAPQGIMSWRKNYYFGGKLTAMRVSEDSSAPPTPSFSPTPSPVSSPSPSPSPSPTPTPTPGPILPPDCGTNFNVACSSDGKKATFSWNAIPNAIYYWLRLNKEPYTDWYNSVGGDQDPQIDIPYPALPGISLDIAPGAKYQYDIQGFNSQNEGGCRQPFAEFSCPAFVPPPPPPSPAKPSCAGVNFPACIVPGSSFTVQAEGVSSSNKVYFPTWSSVNGQDDLVWYSDSSAPFAVTIPQAGHAGGNINVHVYLENADYQNVWCDGREIPLCQ